MKLAFGFLLGLGLVSGAMGQTVQPVRVSAGDPTPNSVVLWAQLRAPGVAKVEISRSQTFSTIDRTVFQSFGNVTAPSRIPVSGLLPSTNYFYRIANALGSRAVGRFRTPPAATEARAIRFGVSGDGETSLLPFVAMRNIPSRDLDFFAYIGDTVYADFGGAAQTLDQYRAKHEGVLASVWTRAYLVQARAATNWLVTIDDHEVVNDFAGGAFEGTVRFNQTGRYANGLQAFFEYNPLSQTGWPSSVEERLFNTRRLYRRWDYGTNATFIMTDCRSYRDPAFSASGQTAFLNASFDASRTMLGESQLQRLIADLRDAQNRGIRWKVVAVSVPMMNLGTNSGARDKWDGYLHERTRLLRTIHQEGIQNVVFVSADIHGGLVNDLSFAEGPTSPQTRVQAWDISTGPIAFNGTYGPNLQSTALSSNWQGVVSSSTYNSLNALQKELYIQDLLNRNRLSPVGYNPIGLQDSTLPATLLQGTYSATHHYAWTEFEISATGAELLVTTWGIAPYSSSQLNSNPDAIIDLQPQIVHQFRVLSNPGLPRQLFMEPRKPL